MKLEGESRAAPFRATPRTGWWGASKFISSGCLEGLEKVKKVDGDKRESFTEDTQASLYNMTKAGKVSGKQGLGSGEGKFCRLDLKSEMVANVKTEVCSSSVPQELQCV